MPITIKDALDLDSFRACRLLAGRGGINNIILYTDGMEVPDIAPWLTKNLLLITTGYSIKDNPDAVAQLIRHLHQAGSAGLAIKTKFVGEICTKTIDLANKLNLPLIQVPDDMPFVSLFAPLMNAISCEQNARLKESHFFIDLITQNVKNEEEAKFKAKNLNWPNPPITLLVFDIDQFEELSKTKTEDELHFMKESIAEMINQTIYSQSIGSTVILKSDSFTILVPNPYKKETVLSAICKIQAKAAERFGVSLTAGISAAVNNYLSLPQGYDDARDAILIARAEKSINGVALIQEYKLEQALLHSRENPYFIEFVRNSIQIIEDYDRKNHTELFLTLTELVGCMGVKTKAAERLFLHRNTLLYRIKKIEALTGFHLSRSEDLISLGIALKLRSYV